MSCTFDPLTCSLQGRFLIEASAGTGKTYTLTVLYLRLLLGNWVQGADPQIPQRDIAEILVVTFTKPATIELRERIRLRIYQLRCALQKDDKTHQDVIDLFGTQSVTKEVITYLHQAEQRMDEAAIFTIHSFCQRMLDRFRFETGRLHVPKLIDDEQALKQQAIEDYWREYIYAAPHTRIVFIQEFCKSPLDLARQIQRWLARPCPESLPVIEDLDAWLAELDAECHAFKACWQAGKDTLRQAVEGQVQRYTPEMVASHFEIIEAWITSPSAALNADVCKSLTQFAQTHLDSKKLKKNGIAPNVPLSQHIDALLKRVDARKETFYAHAIRHGRARFLQLKQRYNQQGFDDLLLDLDQALTQDKRGHLATAIHSLYPCALIDEFQDTDAIQYRIFRAVYLTDADRQSCLFFIGDPKQAIYSFRGADIFTYMQARAEIDTRYTLATNWRSTPALIEAVNTVFADQGQTPSFLYEAIPFVPVQAGKAHAGDFSLNGETQTALTFWHTQADKADAARREMAEACAFEIHRILSLGQAHQALLEDKPVQAQDIAVLVRNSTEAKAVQAALHARGIPSAYLSNSESVFAQPLAQALYRLLMGILHAQDTQKVRAALATPLMGYSFAQLAHLNEDESAWDQEVNQFHNYLKIWRRQGVLAMLRTLFFQHQVAAKLRNQADGGRHLTDVMHMGELLQQAEKNVEGEHALLRWLHEHIDNPNHQAKSQQRRLDSEYNLVQIVTIHKSKGLEYPLVFLPFSCFASKGQNQKDCLWTYNKQFKIHLTLNFNDAVLKEALAEDLRLLYVALTRAVYKIWVGMSVLSSNKINPIGSLLGLTDKQWTWPDIHAALAEFMHKSAEIEAMPTPTPMPLPLLENQENNAHLQARRLTHAVPRAWRMTSYSELVRPLVQHHATTALPTVDPWASDSSVGNLNIFTFPRGALAGQFLHQLFETLEFCNHDKTYIRNHVQTLLAASPFEDIWLETLTEHVYQVLSTTLVEGIVLNQLKPEDMRVELEFVYDIGAFSLADLDACIRQFDPLSAKAPALTPERVQGLLRGFIDLIFVWQGRYYILDYKSNHLGDTVQDYHSDALIDAMCSHRYDLQYQLYAVALHRLLRWRLPNYHPDIHFGGVLYVFLRGVHASGQGVFFTRPNTAFLEALDKVFTHA